VAVAKRFHMPNSATAAGPASNAPFWYGFDYGSVHFTILSSEHDLRRGSPQREVHSHMTPDTVHLYLSGA
jgi:hypothetical protein